jgi:hypothetical protein
MRLALTCASTAAGAILFCVLAETPRAGASPTLPDFAPANFAPGAAIDNTYFPLTPGTRFRAAGNITDEEGENVLEEDEDFVTSETVTLAGVVARVVRARVWEDGVLAEDTRDYYAQDKAGNVWYMGEDTQAFERDDEGNVVSTDTTGSWRAGVNGAKPGFIMPVDRPIGFNYFQEFAPADEALDQATIISTGNTITTPAGTFTNVLKTQEETELEPGVIEFKYYAPGVGVIRTEEDIGADGVPGAVLELTGVITGGAAIPLPAALLPGLFGLALVVVVAARRRSYSSSAFGL